MGIGCLEFCNTAALAVRLRVSEQRMRARLRRSEREGRLRRARGAVHRPVAVTWAEIGGGHVGLPMPAGRGWGARGHRVAVGFVRHSVSEFGLDRESA